MTASRLVLICVLLVQDPVVCRHPTLGRSHKIDLAALSTRYSKLKTLQLVMPSKIDLEKQNVPQLPACKFASTREIEVNLPKSVVGSTLTFDSTVPPELAERFKITCVPTTIHIRSERNVVVKSGPR